MSGPLPDRDRSRFLKSLEKELESAGIEAAKEESERILEDALGLTRTRLFLDLGHEVPAAAVERSLKILEGRKKRVPLAFLLGKACFRDLELFVNDRVLIPRPETEILVDAVVREMKRTEKIRRAGLNPSYGTIPDQPISFLDIGTGSGAIAIALLKELPNARGTLLDISAEALEVARKNVEKYGFEKRATLEQGDILPHPNFFPEGEGKRMRGSGRFDLIVSNPPYLSETDFKTLQPELEYEPRTALDGGKDGLDFYRTVIPAAEEHLNPGGRLAFEVGMGQAEQVSAWLLEAGYVNIQRFQDLIGIERVVIAAKKEKTRNPKREIRNESE